MPLLAKNEYLMRHDKVCTHSHYSICKVLGMETTDKWYTHVRKLYNDLKLVQVYRKTVKVEKVLENTKKS